MMLTFSPLRVLVLIMGVALGAGCSKEAKVERAIARGDKHQAEGHFDLAEAEYQASLRLVGRHPQATGKLGMLYLQQGRHVPSYILLQDALNSDPDNLEIRLAFGTLSQRVGKTVDARSAAKMILESQPANEAALLLLAETCLTSRDQAETRRLIGELQGQTQPAAGFHIALAALSLAVRDYAAAEPELKKALQLDPKSAAAFLHLGRLHAARNESAEASAAYKSAADLSPLRSLSRIEYINHLATSGAGATALQEIKGLTQQAPDFIPALTYEMNFAYRERRYDDATAVVEKILERDRTNHDALSQRAAIRMAKGDVEGSIGALRMMETIYTRSAVVNYRLANAYLRKGDQSSAEECLMKAVQFSPNYDEAIVLLAELNLQKGNAAAAVTSLTQLLARQPRVARAYVLLAQAYQSQGRIDECLKVLRAYTDRAPNAPEGPYFTAMVLQRQGRKDEARQALEQALRAAGDYWPAAEMLLNDDLQAGRMAEAKERAERWVGQHADRAIVWLLRAKVRFQEGDFAGAESDARKSIELAPTEQHGYLLRARSLLATQNPEQAIETLAALSTRTKQAGAYFQLGVLNGTLAKHDAARAAYEKAIEIDPKFVPALNNLASVLSVELAQPDQALRIASQARDLAPNDAHVMDTLGWVLFQKGQYQKALPLLKESSERMPNEPLIQFHLGMTYYRLGHEESARQTLERANAGRPAAPVAAESQARLALLAINPATAGPDVQRDLEARLQGDPEDPVILSRLAAIQARAGKHAEAVRLFEAALKINPRSIPLLLGLVDLYAGPAANPARVRELSEMAHAVAPYDGEMAWKLGRIAWKMKDVAGAAKLLQAAARVLADKPDLLLETARATFATGRIPDAIRALEQALALPAVQPNRQEIVRFAKFVAATGDPSRVQAVAADARQVLALDPDDAAALMITALAQEIANDHTGAMRTYEALMARYPQFAPGQRQQAVLLAEHLGDDKRAEELALQARKALPDDPALAYVLGTVRFRKGEYADSIPLLQQAARGQMRPAQTYFHLGMAQFQLKNVAESRAHLQRSLELKLPAQESGEARRILEQLRKGDFAR